MDKDITQFIPHPKVGSVANSNPTTQSSGASRSQVASNRGDIKCYGCGEQGHSLNFCPKIKELILNGIIKRDENNKYVMADGSFIQRGRDEPIATAVQRHRSTVQANFISFGPVVSETEEESDSEDEEAFAFPVERSDKVIKDARKTRFEGVFPPSKPEWAKEKSSDKGKGKAKPKVVEKPSGMQPVEIQQPTFDPSKDEDIIMEDTAKPTSIQEKSSGKRAQDSVPKRQPMQSKVSQHVQPMNILDRILNTPLTMSVGEVIGTSREITQCLQEVIKNKRQTVPTTIPKSLSAPENVSAAVVNLQSKRPLIEIMMHCDGMPIKAIVDTGSMMNIVSEETYRNYIPRPCDRSETIGLLAANNSTGQLKGLVSNVELRCGAARTWANLYVIEKAPFQLLLGRPWQRDNHISIEERERMGHIYCSVIHF